MGKASRARVAKPERLTRFVVLGDTHGDQLDPEAGRVALEFVEDFKPDIRVHLGDAFDFRWLRRGASDGEVNEGVKADIEAGLDFLTKYKPTHFLLGNHDHRLYEAIQDPAGVVRHAAAQIAEHIAEQLGPRCVIYPHCKRRGVMRLADYSIVHGYCTGSNAVHKTAATYGNVLMGHVHRVASSPAGGLENRVGYSIGCLCKLDMDYTRKAMNTLEWEHGFAYGVIDNGRAIVFQAAPKAGRWYFAESIGSRV